MSKTEVTGDALKEAQHINKSLSSLGDVIAALAAKSKHVPFRNSKLTYLLQDSLSGSSKACCLPVGLAAVGGRVYHLQLLGECVSSMCVSRLQCSSTLAPSCGTCKKRCAASSLRPDAARCSWARPKSPPSQCQALVLARRLLPARPSFLLCDVAAKVMCNVNMPMKQFWSADNQECQTDVSFTAATSCPRTTH